MVTRLTCEQGRGRQGRKELKLVLNSSFAHESLAWPHITPLAYPTLDSQKLLLSGQWRSSGMFSFCSPLEQSPTWFPHWQSFGLAWHAGRWCCLCNASTYFTCTCTGRFLRRPHSSEKRTPTGGAGFYSGESRVGRMRWRRRRRRGGGGEGRKGEY